MLSTPTKNPFSLGKGPDALARWIERDGLSKLARWTGLEPHTLKRIAFLGVVEPEELPVLDLFLGIRMDV